MVLAWQELLEHPQGNNPHIGQIYRDDAFLLEGAGHFICSALRQDQGMVLIMRGSRLAALATRLECEGVDLDEAVQCGQVTNHDADAMLQKLMKNGKPDRHRFHRVIGDAIRTMRRRYPVVRAFGELVDILWRDGRVEHAARIEEFWKELARIESFALLCAYRIDTLDAASYSGAFDSMCHTYTHLIPARDYRRFDDAVDRASREVLDTTTTMMLESVAQTDKPRTEMPRGQVILLWLARNMPRTAERVLSRVRDLYPGVA